MYNTSLFFTSSPAKIKKPDSSEQILPIEKCTTPFRAAAKFVAVMELIWLLLMFAVILMAALGLAVREISHETSYDGTDMITPQDFLYLSMREDGHVVLVILAIFLLIPIGFAACLVQATSKSSNRTIRTRLNLVVSNLVWKIFCLVVFVGRESCATLYGSKSNWSTLLTVVVFVIQLIAIAIVCKFMMELRNISRKIYSQV